MRSIWPEKDPEEALVAGFLYANEIAVGESISTVSVSCSVLSGTDLSPALVLNGAPTISGTTVLQPFHGGVSGVSYTLRCVATLVPTARILVRAATLPVRTA